MKGIKYNNGAKDAKVKGYFLGLTYDSPVKMSKWIYQFWFNRNNFGVANFQQKQDRVS